MSIFIQRKPFWLSTCSREDHVLIDQVQLLSMDGLATFISVPTLMSVSPFLQSIMPHSCSFSMTTTISVPSATDNTLKLMAQILCTGKTEDSEGLENTMDSLKQLQEVMLSLGINIRIGPKPLVLKVEVVDSNDNWNIINDKPIAIAKKSTNSEHKSSARIKFRQTGLLNDFKVSIVKVESTEFYNLDDYKNENHGVENSFKSDPLVEEVKIQRKGNPNEADHQCPDCNKMFRNEGKMMRHFIYHHKSEDSQHQKLKDLFSLKFKFTCHVCAKKFLLNKNLTNHIRKLHGTEMLEIMRENVKQFECTFCEEKFIFKKILKNHIKNCHGHEMVATREKKLECQFCNVRFTMKKGLLRHIKWNCHGNKIAATRENAIECSFCDEKFIFMKNLKNHITNCHGHEMVATRATRV